MNKQISPIQEIKDDFIADAKVRLFFKREDLNHPTIQGNKFWKLLYNVQEAQNQGKHTLLTFGGAFSNHIYATAAAGKANGLKTIGIVRGERIEPLNYTLQTAEEFGMELHFVSRSAYREKNTPLFLEKISRQFGACYIIPEGGTNHLAIKGCESLAKEIQQQDSFDTVCLSVGTGGTIAGLIAGFNDDISILGFSSLKGDFLQKEVAQLLFDYHDKKHANWKINSSYHFGGYAKHNPVLISFINKFKEKQGISLEPIYTGKMMYGLCQMIQNGAFEQGQRILAIHTGGMQGLVGFNARYGNIVI